MTHASRVPFIDFQGWLQYTRLACRSKEYFKTDNRLLQHGLNESSLQSLWNTLDLWDVKKIEYWERKIWYFEILIWKPSKFSIKQFSVQYSKRYSNAYTNKTHKNVNKVVYTRRINVQKCNISHFVHSCLFLRIVYNVVVAIALVVFHFFLFDL